jgi:hypothetical protein
VSDYATGDEEVAASGTAETAGFVPDRLEALPDEALRAVIDQAKHLLGTRKLQRQAEALAAIRELAQQNDLNVHAKRRGRKRGRPRKAGNA